MARVTERNWILRIIVVWQNARVKLIGQFDSPFVRRVGIAMRFYDIPFEHLAYSVFGDRERIAKFNPLTRAPTLVLDDGMVLVESYVCLEYLDQLMSERLDGSRERLLLPRGGPQRIDGLRLCAFATGVCDKAVSLAYEREVRESRSISWTERCTKQVLATLDLLEAQRPAYGSPFVFGDRISHADIALSCAIAFIESAHPGFLQAGKYPALRSHSAHCEAMPEFSSVFQPFAIPAPRPKATGWIP